MVISELGPMFFFIGAAAHFLVTVGLVAGEKEAGLLLALRTLAVADGAGHIGWFAPLALTGALAQALMVVLARYAFGIPLFVYCDARVLLMLFTLYSSAMIALALLIAAALPNARQAHALAFVLFVVGLMLQVSSSPHSAHMMRLRTEVMLRSGGNVLFRSFSGRCSILRTMRQICRMHCGTLRRRVPRSCRSRCCFRQLRLPRSSTNRE